MKKLILTLTLLLSLGLNAADKITLNSGRVFEATVVKYSSERLFLKKKEKVFIAPWVMVDKKTKERIEKKYPKKYFTPLGAGD